MTYSELVWSVSIDDEDYFLYEPSASEFVEFLNRNGIDCRQEQEVDMSKLRRQVFVFGKTLRKKLRQEYPNAMSISVVFGEAKYVREPSVPTELKAGFFNKCLEWIGNVFKG